MKHMPSAELQVRRYKARKQRNKIVSGTLKLILRIIMIALTLICFYTVVFDEDAVKLKGIAASVLFLLFYAQCASLSMYGLSLLKLLSPKNTIRLTLLSIMICAPLYFVIFIVSLIPITSYAVFFITVFPIIVLNALPMESICEEFSFMYYPKRMFWIVQTFVQLLIVAVSQFLVTVMLIG